MVMMNFKSIIIMIMTIKKDREDGVRVRVVVAIATMDQIPTYLSIYPPSWFHYRLCFCFGRKGPLFSLCQVFYVFFFPTSFIWNIYTWNSVNLG